MHKDSCGTEGIFIDLQMCRCRSVSYGFPSFSTFPKCAPPQGGLHIFDVENYSPANGQFPPSLGLFRPVPLYIGCGCGGYSTTVIHSLWKTRVEKLHTHRFALYFSANIGFSTAVFNSLWISRADFAPFFHDAGQRRCRFVSPAMGFAVSIDFFAIARYNRSGMRSICLKSVVRLRKNTA